MQGAKRVVMVDSCSRFSDFIDPSELSLPPATMAYESGTKVS